MGSSGRMSAKELLNAAAVRSSAVAGYVPCAPYMLADKKEGGVEGNCATKKEKNPPPQLLPHLQSESRQPPPPAKEGRKRNKSFSISPSVSATAAAVYACRLQSSIRSFFVHLQCHTCRGG